MVSTVPANPTSSVSDADATSTAGNTVTFPDGSNIVAGIGRLFGIDVEAAFDMAERSGLTSTLANPNLTTVSGETAEFWQAAGFPS